jgi:hypothetical protein
MYKRREHRFVGRAVVLAICLGTIPKALGDCQPQWLPGDGIPGVNGTIQAMATWDPDGAFGPTKAVLAVGGNFNSAGGVPLNNIGVWDGSTWSPLGAGTNFTVTALVEYDDGTGPALYAGGLFTRAGDVNANNIAKWDGSSWSALEDVLDGPVFALAVFDKGTGPPVLCVGGSFAGASDKLGRSIGQWNGFSWSPMGPGMNGPVHALAVYDDGGGRALYAGGAFTVAGNRPASRIAKWNGVAWRAVGGGFYGSDYPYVLVLRVFNDGLVEELYAGGGFSTPARGIARWNGVSWRGLGDGLNGRVYALAEFDDGSGPALFAAGIISRAGEIDVNRVAKINYFGGDWTPVGFGLGTGGQQYVKALTVYDDGSGAALYAGGSFMDPKGGIADDFARWRCPCPHCDGDGDDDVDGFDFLDLYYCLDGPNVPYRRGCEDARFDGGNDVDLADFAVFQNNFTGELQ